MRRRSALLVSGVGALLLILWMAGALTRPPDPWRAIDLLVRELIEREELSSPLALFVDGEGCSNWRSGPPPTYISDWLAPPLRESGDADCLRLSFDEWGRTGGRLIADPGWSIALYDAAIRRDEAGQLQLEEIETRLKGAIAHF